MNDHIFDYYNNRPLIFADFLFPREKISVLSLVDSGSDTNISFKEIGKSFGIKFSGKPDHKVEGIGKTLKGWKYPVEMEFLGQKFSIDIIWINKGFDAEEDMMMILGRNPLFDKFDIEFKENKKIIFRKRVS